MTVFRAWENLRSAVIFLARFGFRADDVEKMCHLEVNAWVNSYLKSQGVKAPHDDENSTTYVFERRKKSGT